MELKKIIKKFALHNAFLHNNKANINSVLGKILGEYPDLRAKVKEIMPIISEVVNSINSLSGIVIRTELESVAPELLHREKQTKELELPELLNIKPSKKVVMRFAPGPSGPLHIGHTRAAILNDEYVKRYDGKLIIRLEDTNPMNIDVDAYDLIPEDLSWLKVNYSELINQSTRFGIYLDFAEKLLQAGHAYICTCPVEDWRGLKNKNQPCKDRELSPNEQLDRWQKISDREYSAGEASFIVKTDLNHPNPAVRDFVGLRIIEDPHPLTGETHYLYPTYNFSVAIDDHLMDITHILRGKDHLNNTFRQKYVYNYFGWPLPEFLHYGWVSMPDVVLKTSLIKEGIETGKYSGWSDVQLGTLQALAKRGIQPEAIRKYWLDVGIKEVDIEFSWENLYSYNKELIDRSSNRYFFVWDPVKLKITGVDSLTGQAPKHPDFKDRGTRDFILNSKKADIDRNPSKDHRQGIFVYVTRTDLEGVKTNMKLRLKDLCNVEISSIDLSGISICKFIGTDLEILKQGAKIIHWIPEDENLPITIHLPDGSIKKGFCEINTKDALEKIVQFERFGFVRIDPNPDPEITGWFIHK